MIEDRTRRKEEERSSDGPAPQHEKHEELDQEKEKPDTVDHKEERRYQKRSQDPEGPDNLDEKRYMTRLKPSDHKPSNYLWGYKDWSPMDEERTGEQQGPVTGNDNRDLPKHEDRENHPTSTGKVQDEGDQEPLDEGLESGEKE